MSKKTLKQISISQGSKRMTTWVDRHAEIKEGSLITLKDDRNGDNVDKGKWRVDKIYHLEIDPETLKKQRGFDNNNYDKHVGLGL